MAEKARYLYEWVKFALGIPSNSDAELKMINEYYTYTDAMKSCRVTGMCR